MNCTLLIDNGHGKNTPGKCSPLSADGTRFYEWEFSRRVAKRIMELAPDKKLKVVLLVPEDEDIPLSTRAARANSYISQHPDEECVFVSIHGNAAGNGQQWMSARGWEIWTTVGKTNSDILSAHIAKAAIEVLPSGTKFREDKTDGDCDKEKNFTVIYKTKCPAVLTENFFYDNIQDCSYMKSDEGVDTIAMLHLVGVIRYFDYLEFYRNHGRSDI